MQTQNALRLAIDIGGTFTDTVLIDAQQRILASAKVPTTPDAPARGALGGAEEVLARAAKSWSDLTGLIHGTTLATNALIERRGARVASLTTEGFRDILEIAYERRYSQYAINLTKPDLIVPRARAFTVPGRMDARGVERRALDQAALPALCAALRGAKVDALAVCLLHAYANPAHELAIKAYLEREMPGLAISLSHEVSPEAREFDRLCTTIANAYIQPLMGHYLIDFQDRCAARGLRCPVLMMTSGGGMTTVETAARLPIRLVESGPAGGAILAARLAQQIAAPQVLSFDMGGTTAKLCLIDDYHPQTARRFEIGRAERFVQGSGMPVRIPVIEMIEIGAGGGSIAHVDRLGRLRVGPQSAGAEPGPAAFGKGGAQPTVTDADVAQGLIDPERFARGKLSLDTGAARDVIDAVLGRPMGLPADAAAQSVSEIVDENMAAAGRMHAVESGKDIGARVMIAFGGNGPLHATRVARRARVRRIVIPPGPGVGSAIGFLFAPVSFEIIQSCYFTLDDIRFDQLNGLLAQMRAQAEAVVRAGAPTQTRVQRCSAFMRYRGQGHEIEIDLPGLELRPEDISTLRAAFESEYKSQFRRTVPGMTIEILNWAVRVASDAPAPVTSAVQVHAHRPEPLAHREILCSLTGVWRPAALFERASLAPGAMIAGPALIVEPQTTTWVSADFSARVDGAGNIWLEQLEEASS